MLKTIYEMMYRLSEQHKFVRSFRYGTLSHNQGIGEELLPQVFLESPIYFNANSTKPSQCKFTFDILFNNRSLDELGLTNDLSPLTQQIIAEEVAKSFIAKINDDENIIQMDNYTVLQLNNFYDNNTFGVRVSLDVVVNPNIFWCSDLDANFDPDKVFEAERYLPEYKTDSATGCSTFSINLPKKI